MFVLWHHWNLFLFFQYTLLASNIGLFLFFSTHSFGVEHPTSSVDGIELPQNSRTDEWLMNGLGTTDSSDIDV